jgi:hypothetical protein
MKLIYFLLAITSLQSFGQSSIIDFGNSAEKNKEWILLSDNIMGGVTKSKIEYTNNSVLLSGNISLDNYCGFTSIKTKYKVLTYLNTLVLKLSLNQPIKSLLLL